MIGYSTLRAGNAKRRRRAALPPGAHGLRGNTRAYVGLALGQSRAPWFAQGLRVLTFLATGLILGALVLMGAD